MVEEKILTVLRSKLNDALGLFDDHGVTANKDCGANAIIMHKPYFAQARNEIWEAVEMIDRLTGHKPYRDCKHSSLYVVPDDPKKYKTTGN